MIHKGREVPELKLAVQQGKVTLSKAKKICSVITPSNHKEWIDLAKHETSRVIEKCVAGANPKEVVRESIQYKTADRLELKLRVSEEWITILSEVKDLLSQKKAACAIARAEKRAAAKTKTEQFPGTVAQNIHSLDLRSKRSPLKRWLDHHHITPVSEGGSDHIENLTTLCQAHHRLQHRNPEMVFRKLSVSNQKLASRNLVLVKVGSF